MLDLKVMRLSPPGKGSGSSTRLTMENEALLRSSVLRDVSEPIDSVPIDQLLLPTALTKVLIGETFVAYLHLANNSVDDVSDVSMVAELKSSGSEPVIEMHRSGSPATLQSGKFLEADVSQALHDRGVHTVECCVRYKARGEMRILRYVCCVFIF